MPEKTPIFIAWSGEPSRRVAREWVSVVESVFDNARPWMSEHIERGADWLSEIRDKLNQAPFLIICVTPENKHSDWILFEAGSVWKAVGKSRVAPYLIGFEGTQSIDLPLSMFQETRATRLDTLELLKTVNKALGDGCVGETVLLERFESIWPRVAAALAEADAMRTREGKAAPPDQATMIAQVLQTVKRLERMMTPDFGTRRMSDVYREYAMSVIGNKTRLGLGNPWGVDLSDPAIQLSLTGAIHRMAEADQGQQETLQPTDEGPEPGRADD